MFMWEEAEFFSVLGIDIYAYGLFTALGAAAMLLVLGWRLKKQGAKPGTWPLAGVLILLLGALGSRMLYCLLEFSLDAPYSLKMLWLFTGGGHSMMGALLGGMAGAALAGKILHEKPLACLDAFAPAAMAFVIFARLGEMFVPDFGISRPLIYDISLHLPITVATEYESYLATYLLEAAAALAVMIVLLRDAGKQRRQGNSFVLMLLLFSAAQIVLESLRYDRHMSYSFIRMQQIIAALMLTAGVILAAVRAGKGKKWPLLIGMMLAVAGIGVALEFAVDRTEINRYLLYAGFVLLMVLPVAVGIHFRKRA